MRRPSQAYVLYTLSHYPGFFRRSNRPAEYFVMLSLPSLKFAKNNDHDYIVQAFQTVQQCEDFIRTAYHQKMSLRELGFFYDDVSLIEATRDFHPRFLQPGE